MDQLSEKIGKISADHVGDMMFKSYSRFIEELPYFMENAISLWDAFNKFAAYYFCDELLKVSLGLIDVQPEDCVVMSEYRKKYGLGSLSDFSSDSENYFYKKFENKIRKFLQDYIESNYCLVNYRTIGDITKYISFYEKYKPNLYRIFLEEHIDFSFQVIKEISERIILIKK